MNEPECKNRGGRPYKHDPIKVIGWRKKRGASISETAKHWKVSAATVKRWTSRYGDEAELARAALRAARHDYDMAVDEYGLFQMMEAAAQAKVSAEWSARWRAAYGTVEEAATERAIAEARCEATARVAAKWRAKIGPVPTERPTRLKVAQILENAGIKQLK